MNYARILRHIRQRVFDYPAAVEEKVERVMQQVKRRVLEKQETAPVERGPFSGLTRAELAKTGTCEADWY